MSLERKITNINENYFFSEFTYEPKKFSDANGNLVELADGVISLDQLLIVFQLKERVVGEGTTEDNERRWFENKILKLAVKQIKSTRKYLSGENGVKVANQRGHDFILKETSSHELYQIVAYQAHKLLPSSCKEIKYYISKEVGIIHILSYENYGLIISTLITPSEVAEYFSFRRKLIENFSDKIRNIPESCLLGQYISGQHKVSPSIKFDIDLDSINKKGDEWNIEIIIRRMHDKIIFQDNETDYYFIAQEMAKLMRHEARHFKIRFDRAYQDAMNGEVKQPYRMAISRLDCGFVFIACPKNLSDKWQAALENFSQLHKYDRRLTKCVGLIFVAENDGYFRIHWLFLNYPWENDDILEQQIKESVFSLRGVRLHDLDRY